MRVFLVLMMIGVKGLSADHGTYGHTMAIEEEDLIEELQRAPFNVEAFQERMREKVLTWRPKAVEGLGTKCRVHFYDPTFEVSQDIRDHQGRLLHRKGTKVNPLHYRDFKQKWLFVDGEKPYTAGENTKVIFVTGNPLGVYFDQGGELVKKFGIQNVPALLEQVGDKIRIQEGECD